MDGDAQLCENINEIDTEDYDVGVTLRDRIEFQGEWYEKHYEIVKYLNAGVIFFRPSIATETFVERWRNMTNDLGNDQMALNKLACMDDYPSKFSVNKINEVRIKYFPCKKYNYYYFREGLIPDIKIMHFKADVRQFYPFNWKRRIICKLAPIIRNKNGPLLKYLLKIKYLNKYR
jgi:hypothetical protein